MNRSSHVQVGNHLWTSLDITTPEIVYGSYNESGILTVTLFKYVNRKILYCSSLIWYAIKYFHYSQSFFESFLNKLIAKYIKGLCLSIRWCSNTQALENFLNFIFGVSFDRRRCHRFTRRDPRWSDSFLQRRTFSRSDVAASHVDRRTSVGHSRRGHGPTHQGKDRRAVRTSSQRPRRTFGGGVERNVDAFKTVRTIS